MIHSRPDRRALLSAAGGLLLYAGFHPFQRAWAQPKFAADPFSLGVAAGDPSPDDFVIWTRLAPSPLAEHGGMPMLAVPVRWEVAADEHFVRIVRSGEAMARPELAHSVHVEVAGLQPHRPYWYRFTVDGAARSGVGVVRTAPAAYATPDSIRMVVAGCQAYPQGWYDAWRHVSEEPDLDAVFHYGDYIYENSAYSSFVVTDAAGEPANRRHLGDEIYSLNDYRRRYAQYKSDPHLKAAHAAAAFIMSFDDHEVDNDWASRFDQDGTPPEVFLLRRMAAMQAWYEHMPVRREQFPRPDGLCMYRRLDYGRLLRMHVLDTRSYRVDQLCANPSEMRCRQADTPASTLLGPEQEAWLAEGLRGSRARWNLIAQQVRVMPLARRSANGAVMPVPVDSWSGYPQARSRLVEAISGAGLTNVVIASGDSHMHNVGTVPLRDDEPDGPAAATEFLASSISSGGDGAPITPSIQAYLDGDNPNLDLANHQRGYDLFEIRPDMWRTDVKVMDQVQAPGGTASLLQRYVVEPLRAKLIRV